MSQFARVESLDAVRDLKVALIKFTETARLALIEAESDLQRSLNWVQQEQRVYWQGQMQKRYQAMIEAREALRQKLLFRSALQTRDSAAEERKAVAVDQRAFDEAEDKIKITRAWGVKLNQEAILYRGMAQRLANQADICLPGAVNVLDRVIENLETYLAFEAPQAAASTATTGDLDGVAGVARSVAQTPADSALPDTLPLPPGEGRGEGRTPTATDSDQPKPVSTPEPPHEH
jgi:hypothetical protein